MSWVDRLSGWLDRLPRSCLLCDNLHRHPGPLCASCLQALPRNPSPCQRCGEPQSMAGLVCRNCQRQPPPFEAVICPYLYQPPLDRLIQRFKFHGELRAGHALWPALSDQAAHLPLDALVPVPIHASRHRQRGFNQALWLADRLATRLQLPVMDVLEKTRPTTDQVGLNRKRRMQNLRNSFRCRTTSLPAHIGLVDDVVSTSATAATLSRLLLQHGCRQVRVLALARTPPPAH